MYINDLPNISNVIQFFLFADDTNIYLQSGSPQQLEYFANKELKKLNSWLIVNRLSLNFAKTNFVIFRPYNKPMNYKITLKFNKKAISERSAIKYLGVMLDSSLTWHSQIDLISKKLLRAIGLMYKIRPLVNPRIMKTLYYSLVYPYLIYAVEVWGSADDTVTDRLLLLQKRIVLLLTYSDIRQDNFSFKSSNPLFF